MTNSVKQRVKKIKVVLTDVDGVLTDGGMYYTKEGDMMKKFHVRDGMGVTILRKNGIPTIIVTKEKNIIVTKWAQKMKIEKTFQGVLEKDKILEIVCKNFKVDAKEVAYIGDDVNDVPLLKKVGFAATPKDGISLAKKNSHYICTCKGGEGALREIAELILLNK